MTGRWEINAAFPAKPSSQPLLLVIVTDISAQRSMEDALRVSEAKFRSYLEYAPLGVFIADRAGCFLEVNNAAVRLTGYDQAALLRMGVPDLIADADLDTGQRQIAAVVHDGFTEGTLRIRRRDGQIIWASVRAVRLTPNRFMAFCLDVTEQVDVEQTLRTGSALPGGHRYLARWFLDGQCPGAAARSQRDLRAPIRLLC